MKRKKEPRHGWATVCGATTRKAISDYSAVAASRQELINHPVVTGGELLQESCLTSARQADNLQPSKQYGALTCTLNQVFFSFRQLNLRRVSGCPRGPRSRTGFENTRRFFIWRNHHE